MTASQIDNYIIIQQLGQGARGIAWLAEHVTLHHKAVLKTLQLSGRESQDEQIEILERFIREGTVGAHSRHPHLVAIYDFQLESSLGPYIAMEYMDGTSLDKYTLTNLPTILDVASQIADGLFYLHSHRIIHRDLKPGNVFVSDQMALSPTTGDSILHLHAKIGDFGYAGIVGAGGSRLTEPGIFAFGTPIWSSPEQIKSTAHADQRTDLYALGMMLWQWLSGRLMPDNYVPALETLSDAERMRDFDLYMESLAALLRAKAQPPAAPSRLNPTWNIPPELDALTLRLLAADPAARPQDAAEVYRELRSLAGRVPPVAP